jgi:hypothetical protein
MPELGQPTSAEEAATTPAPASGRSKDEIALEMMRFIAVTTGYGKSTQPSAGFSAKPAVRSPEEHADSLLELFDKCRQAVNKPV